MDVSNMWAVHHGLCSTVVIEGYQMYSVSIFRWTIETTIHCVVKDFRRLNFHGKDIHQVTLGSFSLRCWQQKFCQRECRFVSSKFYMECFLQRCKKKFLACVWGFSLRCTHLCRGPHIKSRSHTHPLLSLSPSCILLSVLAPFSSPPHLLIFCFSSPITTSHHPG